MTMRTAFLQLLNKDAYLIHREDYSLLIKYRIVNIINENRVANFEYMKKYYYFSPLCQD